MEEIGKKNDWFIANTMSPDNTFTDFEQEGLNNENIQMLGREKYKADERVQNAFKTADDKFDEKSFNDFYDITLQTYNTFTNKNYDKTVMNDSYFGENNIFVGEDAKRITKPYLFSREKNPFGDIQGVVGPLSKVESDFTVREIAQTQKVLDSATGKFKEATPNEEGFIGALFGANTKVLAQFDEDGMHYDADLGKDVNHFKGEYKMNEYGKPFYETLNKREVYGKQVLSPWDVLTVDGSMADKWNFMSGDDRKKSITGNVVRAAAFAAPYFIPGVGQYYTMATIGAALATDVLPVLLKSGMGLIFNDWAKDSELYRNLNSLQGVGARLQPSQSDESSQSILNIDNVAMMMSDVFGQLAQQRGIAKIPTWLGLQKKEAQAFSMAMKGKTAEQITELSKQYKQVKGLDNKAKFLNANFKGDDNISEMLHKWDLWNSQWSKNLGIAYMAAISATPMHEEAKLNNLDERDAAFMFFGTFAAFGKLMQDNPFARWALEGIGLDEAGNFAKSTIQKAIKETSHLPDGVMSVDDVAKTTMKLIADVAEEAPPKPSSLFRKFKDIGDSIAKKLNEGPYNTLKDKAFAEGVEEMSEEALQDGLKLTYNLFNSLGFTSSDQAKNFEFNDMLARYTLAGLGGAAGGAIVGVQDYIGGNVHGSLPASMKSEFTSMLIHGYEAELREALKAQYDKGLLGSTTLSPLKADVSLKLGKEPVYKTKEDGKMSQNDFVYELLNAEIDFLKKAIFQEGGLNLKYGMNYEARERNLMDFGYTTPIQNDINDLVIQIADVKADMVKAEGGVKDASKDESKANDTEIADLDKKYKALNKELQGILMGERDLEYTKAALFSTNQGLYKNYGVKDLNMVAQEKFKKNFDNLSDEQKAETQAEYDTYTKLQKRKQLMVNLKLFDKDMELTNAKLEILKAYAIQKRALIEGFYNPEDVLFKLRSLNEQANLEIAATGTSMQISEQLQNDLTPLEITPDGKGGATVSTKPLGSIELLQQYLDYTKQQQHINPLLDNFIKQRFDVPFSVNIDYVNTDTDEVETLTSLEGAFQRLTNNARIYYENGLYATLIEDKIRDLKPNINNITKLKEKLRGGLLAFFDNDAQRLQDYLNGFTATEESGLGKLEEGDRKTILDSYNNALGILADSLEYDTSMVTETNENLFFDVNPELQSIKQLTDLVDQYDAIARSKKKSPLHELVAEFAEVDGQEGVKYLFDSINEVFEDLERNGYANQFIMNENVSKQQLERALAIANRIDGTLMAATNYNSVKQIIGYNDALNNVEKLGLPTMEAGEYVFLQQEVSNIKNKIQFLLNLSQFNSAGTIREQKHLAVKLITLNLQGLRGHLEPLKNLGLNTDSVLTAFENSKLFLGNLERLNTKDIPAYDDVSYTGLRVEEGKIRQAFYELVNASLENQGIYKKYFDSIGDKDGVVIKNNELSTAAKDVTEYQNLMYLSRVVNTDLKQFLIDFYGNVAEGDDFLMKQKFSPFYAQEMVTEIAYWSVFSKSKSLDTFELFSKKILPKTDTPLDQRKPKLKNSESYISMLNTIALDGIPGAGKTSVAIRSLQNIMAKNDINTAIYTPNAIQLKGIVDKLVVPEALVNQGKGLIHDLFDNIDGNIYQKIEEAITGKTYKKKDDITENDLLQYSNSRLDLGTEDNAFTIRLNRNSKIIKDFVAKFKSFKIEGKIPSVIIIDESTNISAPALELLGMAMQIHNEGVDNAADKISLLLFGDTEQNGYTFERNDQDLPLNWTQNINVLTAPKLSSSLRAGNNLIVENINSLRAFNTTIEGAHENKQTAMSTDLTLKYTETEKGLFGHKVISSLDEDYIVKQVGISKGSVVLITDKEASLITPILEKHFTKEDYKIMRPNEVQGLEAQLVMIDLMPEPKDFIIDETTYGNYLTGFRNYYTLLSRSEKATLIVDKSINASVINLNTDDLNVVFKDIKLDEKLLEKFKVFNSNSVKTIIENLKTVDQNISSNLKGRVSKEVEILDEDYRAILYNAVAAQLNKNLEHVGKVIVDEKGIPVQYDGENALVYAYHEHLGYSVDKDGNLLELEDPFMDVPLVYKALYDEDINTADKDKVDAARVNLKLIKNAFLNSITGNLKDGANLVSYMTSKARIPNELFTRGSILENVNSFEFLVRTKEFDPEFDTAYKSKISDAEQKGLISYIIAVDPKSWSEEEQDYLVKFTLASLPNINNKNIPEKVKENLRVLHEKHNEALKKSKGTISYFKISEPSEAITRISNLILDKSKTYATFTAFEQDHAHLNISNPVIITDKKYLDDLESNKDRTELHKAIKDINEGKALDLNGKTIVFVSDDFSIPTDKFEAEFIKQVQSAKPDKDGKVTPSKSSIRMVILNANGMAFSYWLKRNQDLLKRLHTEPSLVSVVDRKALTNNYAAARIIARLMVISEQYHYNQKNNKSDMWLPEEIVNTGGRYDAQKLKTFVSRVDEILKISIPGMFGKTYNGLLKNFMNIPNADDSFSLNTQLLSDYLDKEKSNTKPDSLGFLVQTGVYNSLTFAAKEHFLSQNLLKLLEDTNTTVDYKITDDLLSKEEAFEKIKETNERKNVKQAMQNMVAALRVAFFGGRIITDKDTKAKSEIIKSIFAPKDDVTKIDNTSMNEFLSQLDLVLTENKRELKPAVAGKDYKYLPLFPDGIHFDIAVKAVTQEYIPTKTRFVQSIINEKDHLSVNVGISEPKYSFDLSSVTEKKVIGKKEKVELSSKDVAAFAKMKDELKSATYDSLKSLSNSFKMDSDEATNDINDLLDSLPAANKSDVQKFLTKNKLPTVQDAELFLSSKIMSIFETRIKKGTYKGYDGVITPEFTIELDPATGDTSIGGFLTLEKFTETYAGETLKPLMDEFMKINALTQPPKIVTEVLEDNNLSISFEVAGTKTPILGLEIEDVSTFKIITKVLWKNETTTMAITELAKQITQMTDLKEVNEFTAKLLEFNEKSSIIPTEQMSLAKDYLGARVALRKSGADNAAEVESLLKQLFAQITDTKKC